MRKAAKLVILIAALAMMFALAPSSNAGTVRASSVSVAVPPATGIDATGFPRWYRDSNGVKLGVCNVPGPCLVDPTGAERFYFRAVARGSTQGGSRMVFSLALEGAYVTATGLPAVGKETVFARVDVVAQGLPAAGIYTVTHPWGTRNIRVVADPKDGTFNIGNKTGRSQVGGTVHSWAAPLNNPAYGPFFHTVVAPAGFLGSAAANPRKIVLAPGMVTTVLTLDGPTGRVFTQALWQVQGKIF